MWEQCARPRGCRRRGPGSALPAHAANFLSSLLARVLAGIPSSHCSAFVYRKPDTNENTAGTSGSKFLQAQAVLVPFHSHPTRAVDTFLIASVLLLWDSGAERCRGTEGQRLTWVLGPVQGEMAFPRAPTHCPLVPRVGAVRKIPQSEKSQGFHSSLV